MSEKLPKTILDQLTQEESTRYKLYHNAVVQNLRAYNDNPTSAKKKDLDSADKAFAELVANLAGRYGGAAEPAADPLATNWRDYTATGNKAEVLRYLQANGWRVSKSSFYRDIDAAKLRRHKDGTFRAQSVRKYALTWCLPGGVGEQRLRELDTDGGDDLATQKLRAEVDRLHVHLLADQHKLEVAQGKYIPRGQVERETVGRAAVLVAGYEHMVYSRAAEFVALVDGNGARIEMLIAAMLDAKDEWLAAYAEPIEWVVEFE